MVATKQTVKIINKSVNRIIAAKFSQVISIVDKAKMISKDKTRLAHPEVYCPN